MSRSSSPTAPTPPQSSADRDRGHQRGAHGRGRRPRHGAHETTDDFTQEINVVGNILLGFGFVALFVSIFIIYNTFSIVLGQRTRELALLRTIGADPKQIRRSVIGESLVMGVLASAAGIGGGVAIAKGIDALFGLMGIDLSEWPLILAPRTLIVAARDRNRCHPRCRAGACPPGRDRATDRRPDRPGRDGGRSFPQASRHRCGARRRRSGCGRRRARLACFGSGAGIALGAMALFVGVAVLSPLVVGLVTRVFGWPMRPPVASPARWRSATRPATRAVRPRPRRR